MHMVLDMHHHHGLFIVHGFDKKADWGNIKEILEIMFIDILNWLKTQHSDEEVLTLKKIIKKEVEPEFY